MFKSKAFIVLILVREESLKVVKRRNDKRLLIYAHYYYPDVAATGQILMELAEGLAPQFNTTVICVVPSYTGKVEEIYRKKWFYREEINGIHVLRVRVPEFTKRIKKSRIKNILAYAIRAMIATFLAGPQDYIFAISQPPVLGGVLGVWGKIWKRAKLIYNIQDFNPEQIMAIGYSHNKCLLRLMMYIDRFCCRCANKVVVVGRDMMETLETRFSGKKMPEYAFINNWVDEKEIYPLAADDPAVLAFREQYGMKDKFVIMYSGNIGLYYDLEKLIRVIKNFRKGKTMDGKTESDIKTADGKEVVFAFVGAGSVLNKLIFYKEKHHIENIVFIPYQNKENMIYSLNAGDVHWCINAKGIKGVSVPSKAYGIMGVGKPMIGVLEEGSEVRCLIEEIGCGMCCEPGNYMEVANIIQWYIENAGTGAVIKMGVQGRRYLEKNLAKDVSIRKYIEAIESL